MPRTIRAFRRAAGLCTIAALALPVAAQAADYRGQLSETISNGAPGVSPSLTLRATIDNGSGGTPVTTGSLRFTVDAHHLASTAWTSLTTATPGTQLGTMTSEITGPDARPLRVLAQGRDASGQYVRAGLTVPRNAAAIIGSDTIPMLIRRATNGSITFTLDTHVAVGRFAAMSTAATLEQVTLALRNGIDFRGESHKLTLNPTKDTALTNTVAAQACAQPSCVTLRPTTSVAGATVHLPKVVTVQAPQSARYGYRYSIIGAARPGDQVALQGLSSDGLVEARGSAAVRPDGSFLIRTTLRSAFSDDGDLLLPARGRYGVASTEGGNATVYGIAAEDTRVALSQPRLVVMRKPGNKLHFAIRVPGGDQPVRVTIKLGSKTLAQGYANQTGRFFKTIVKPSEKGNLRAVASVPGADTAFSLPTTFSQ
jgi:hypothetical protein